MIVRLLLSVGLSGLFWAPVPLHAPNDEQTNDYKIREKISTSKYGSVVMTGSEKRHIGKVRKGKRPVEITFEVQITEKHYSGIAAERWANGELSSLREADKGTLDDKNTLTLPDGAAADAFPILEDKPVEVGHSWQINVSGQQCNYTLARTETLKGVECAVIETQSQMDVREGSLKRSGSWTIEVASGRIVSWHLFSDVTLSRGGKESVESSGSLADK